MGILDNLLGRQPRFVPTQNRAPVVPSRQETVVNQITALSLVPVSRSISVLETAIQQIPVEVFRGTDQLSTPTWLEYPDINKMMSQAEFIGETVVSMALTGEAFWKVTNGARGVSNIELLKSTDVSVIEEHTGRITYSVNGNNYGPETIRHIKLWHRPGELRGEGPIQRHVTTLKQALDLQRYSDTWFQTSAVPTGILTTTEYLAEDAAIANKQAFIESQKDRSVAVLSSGLKYDSISLNPEEAQFLENQKFMARQIALMFGVPSLYLGLSVEGQGMTYTNGNEDRAKLYEDGLQQYIVRIEKALTDLLPRGQKAKFNLTEFLRPNQLNRYQAYEIGLRNNFITVSEIRETEQLPPLEEAPATTPELDPPVDEQTV